MFKLRPFNFTHEEYATIAAIHHASYSDSRMRGDDVKRVDEYTPQDEYDWVRTVAESDGQIVGYGLYVRALWLDTPDLYTIGWLTHPDYRKRGIASAYWEHLTTDIFPSRTISGILVDTRSDVPAGPQFVEKRGFKRMLTSTESQLTLASFDPAKYAPQTQAMLNRGIVLKPLSELIASDENHLEKLVKLEFMFREDEPSAEPPAPISAEMFQNYYMSSDSYYPEGWFIAVDGEKYVGWCAVLPDLVRPNYMRNGITVIDRDYRRMGLATAMKAHACQHAQSLGAEFLDTSNAATNPMLEINRTLGFVKRYDTFEYKKTL